MGGEKSENNIEVNRQSHQIKTAQAADRESYSKQVEVSKPLINQWVSQPASNNKQLNTKNIQALIENQQDKSKKNKKNDEISNENKSRQ